MGSEEANRIIALVPVLAILVISGGGLASVVGLVAGKLRTKYPTHVVWTLSTMIWVLAMDIIYFHWDSH